MPPPEAFAHLVEVLGIDEHVQVVVYDGGGQSQMSQMAGMTAWTFLYYGHPNIRYLNRGFAKWTAEGLPLASDVPAHEPWTFAPHPVEAVYCTLDQARASVDDDKAILGDVRSLGEYDGSKAEWDPPPRLGHIPGAVHLNYTEIFDADNGTLKPAAELRTLLGAKGITPQATIHTY
ncbi:MAG: rhodanese-like domain-containing protein [Acidobacteriota bacterium]|nr:rhodanese-like domain-containing protein [Acidobacteriota bacterium]